MSGALILKPGRERSVLRRHPWIFSGAVSESPSAGIGDIVRVVSGDATLGWAAWSPASQICARMVAFGDVPVPDERFLRNAVAASVGRRAEMFALSESSSQAAIRLVNAESDGLPGVVADYYAGYIVCQFTSAGAERARVAIARALMDFAPGAKGVGARDDASARGREALPLGGFTHMLGEEPPELVEICENAIPFMVDVRKGHKTGFYLDQRDARAAVGACANGRDVLNCFCYTGGFGLYARASGAASVTQVDVSVDAIALAKKNASLSSGCATELDYVQADVFEYLRRCRDSGKTFDMIVLDPPKFADAKSHALKAARGYKDINLLAMKMLRPGGILATFSCSGAIDAALFSKVLAEAASDACRDMQTIALTGQAADHPVLLSFPEGRYLKGAILRAV